MERMTVCALLSLKLGVANIFLMAYMPKLPALQATPLLTTVVVTDLKPDSVWSGVRILDELLHCCLSWHKSDYGTFPQSRGSGKQNNFDLAGIIRSGSRADGEVWRITGTNHRGGRADESNARASSISSIVGLLLIRRYSIMAQDLSNPRQQNGKVKRLGNHCIQPEAFGAVHRLVRGKRCQQ